MTKILLVSDNHFGQIPRKNPEPVVGNGATMGAGSDSYPYTIIEVTPKKVVIQSDWHAPAPNFDYYSNQEYVYWANPHGTKVTLTLRKNGRWVVRGCDMWSGQSAGFWGRRYYQDPSF